MPSRNTLIAASTGPSWVGTSGAVHAASAFSRGTVRNRTAPARMGVSDQSSASFDVFVGHAEHVFSVAEGAGTSNHATAAQCPDQQSRSALSLPRSAIQRRTCRWSYAISDKTDARSRGFIAVAQLNIRSRKTDIALNGYAVGETVAGNPLLSCWVSAPV
jgi:hypothetical protein